jgi:hypothetical protein
MADRSVEDSDDDHVSVGGGGTANVDRNSVHGEQPADQDRGASGRGAFVGDPEIEPAGRAFEGNGQSSRAVGTGTMAPHTLSTSRDVHNPLTQDARGGGNIASGGGAQIHEGNLKLIPWLMFTSILSGVSLATAIFLMIEYAQMQNNMARMAIHITSNDALLLREGILQPGDQWAGPEGNLEYGRKDQPKPRSK